MDGSKITRATIASALAAAQKAMGPALKDSVNPAFKSKYADLASVVAACMPALNANGIAVIQPTGEDEHGRHVRTIFIHGESGETLECAVPLIVGKNDMQGYGSAVTYARRYGLMCMAGIAPEDDDGNAAVSGAPSDRDQEIRHDNAVGQACAYLESMQSLDDLQRAWKNLPAKVQNDNRAYEMKEARKVKLQAKPVELAGDEIPY